MLSWQLQTRDVPDRTSVDTAVMMSVPSSVHAKDCLRLLAKGLFGLWQENCHLSPRGEAGGQQDAQDDVASLLRLSPKIVEGFQAMLKTAWATSLR